MPLPLPPRARALCLSLCPHTQAGGASPSAAKHTRAVPLPLPPHAGGRCLSLCPHAHTGGASPSAPTRGRAVLWVCCDQLGLLMSKCFQVTPHSAICPRNTPNAPKWPRICDLWLQRTLKQDWVISQPRWLKNQGKRSFFPSVEQGRPKFIAARLGPMGGRVFLNQGGMAGGDLRETPPHRVGHTLRKTLMGTPQRMAGQKSALHFRTFAWLRHA